ncbi:Protein SERAC1 [Madurella mycetomatis]|uniref:Protein SERAC1 n=1 Tax=Madurella mycetomatis TaxID=100816 RepID=A0A175WB58_9PEZI|nr:Protein SERAC1 [Madurella mycetomatis]
MAARFHKLYPPGINAPECSTVDVILVHGVDGHYEDTWRAGSQNDTFWPRDENFLPAYLPKAQVFSWSYNASIKGLGKMRDHALSLLTSLRDRLEDEDTPTRPLLFVCHSSGGVLVKQALWLAFNDMEQYESVARSICGVVFLSTPHSGFNLEGWERFVSDVVVYNGHASIPRPTAKMQNEIRLHCELMSTITKNFESLLNRGFEVASFIEVQETVKLGRVIVNRDNGRFHIDKEHIGILNGDHYGICRFSEADKHQFKELGGKLKWLAEESPVAKRLNNRHRDLLHSLCPDKFHRYHLRFAPTPGTCSWIEEKPVFREWRSKTPIGRLWIDGEPACGKTYLARHITSNAVRDSGTDVLHCFLNGLLPERNTCLSILRSTIHMLVRAHPDLMDKLIPTKSGEAERGGNIADVWAVDELGGQWAQAVAEVVKVRMRKVVVIVDGFDEVDNREQERFLSCFKNCEDLMRKGHPSPQIGSGCLHLLILSRPCASLDKHEYDFMRYTITIKDTRNDIHTTVTDKLRVFASRLEYAQDFQALVCDRLTEAAQGIYLWATVKVVDLEHRLLTQRDMEKQLHNMPKSLEELYDSILGRISEKLGDDVFSARTVLRWIIFRQQALRAEELGIVLALTKIRAQDPDNIVKDDELQKLRMPVAVTKVALYKICGPLIRISGDEIEPVHSSLSRYLMTPTNILISGHPEWPVPHHKEFYMPAEESHVILGNICVAYLTMDYFADSGVPFDPRGSGSARWEHKVRTRMEECPFARYAALCWSKHLGYASSPSPVNHSSGIDICSREILEDENTHYAICWTEVWRLFKRWPRFSSSEDMSRPKLEDILSSSRVPAHHPVTPTNSRDHVIGAPSAPSAEKTSRTNASVHHPTPPLDEPTGCFKAFVAALKRCCCCCFR